MRLNGKEVQFSRRMSRVWKLLCWFLLILSPAALRGAGSASPQKDSLPPSDKTVVMDKFMVTVVKYHWFYAKSDHFEILSSYGDKDFVARVVQCAEQIIKPFERNLTIYRSTSELTPKVIFIGNDGLIGNDAIARFLTAIGTTDDVNPNKGTPRYSELEQKWVPAPALFSRSRPIWCHCAINSEQFIIVSTITKEYMNNPAPRRLETKVVEYGLDLATTYLHECLREKNLNPESVLATPFSHNGMPQNVLLWNPDIPYSSRWIAVNKNNIKIYRFNPAWDNSQIKYWARDDLKEILFDSGKTSGNDVPANLDRQIFDLEKEKMQIFEEGKAMPATTSQAEKDRRAARLQKIQDSLGKLNVMKDIIIGGLLSKPVFGLGDIVEYTGHLPLREPRQGASFDYARKYLSFNRQATDFACYCAFGPNPKTRAAFSNLMKISKKRPITEAVFKACFGVGYDEFFSEMYGFFRKSSDGTEFEGDAWGNPSMVISRFMENEIPKKVTWGDATRGQSSRIIGDWFSVNKQPDIAFRTLRLADSDVPEARNDLEFCAALGLSEMQCGDKAKALPLLEKAVANKIQRQEVYRSLSQLYLENILALKGDDYKLDPTELVKTIEPLFDALKISQSNPRIYLQMLELMRHTNESFPKEFWDTMVTNCSKKFPDNFDLLNQLVPLLLKNGLKDEATQMLEAAGKCVLTAAERQQLEQLKIITNGGL